jgi:hypothetical protein
MPIPFLGCAIPLKFRLSTLLLLVLLAGISLGWYVDHSDHNRREIIGIWIDSPQPMNLGYNSVLEIRGDGTIAKLQEGKADYDRYEGKYTCSDDGWITFHIATRSWGVGSFPSQSSVFSSTFKIDVDIPCRCAIDKIGHLIVQPDRDWIRPDGFHMQWESYARKK